MLPTDIPGYGAPTVISILDRSHPEYTPVAIDIRGLSLNPEIQGGTGYDSGPNGVADASSLFQFNPSVTALDPILGLGAYVSGTYTGYPSATEQDLAGYIVAVGEHALLPRETLNVAIAAVDTQETGFGLNIVAVSNPINVNVKDFRGDGAIVCRMVTLKPELSVTNYRFGGYANQTASQTPSQDRTDYRQSLTGEFTSGGPLRFVTSLHATESIYLDQSFSANSYTALAGIADEATGLWDVRLLAGAATRRPVSGDAITAPVLEASISWMPGTLDSVKLDLAREIDDPDQESAAGYTLSETDIAVAHEYLRNVIVTGSFKFSYAAYFDSPLVESLYSANTGIEWHLDRAFSLNASYAFNDRQANFLKAANEHIVILGFTWSP